MYEYALGVLLVIVLYLVVMAVYSDKSESCDKPRRGGMNKYQNLDDSFSYASNPVREPQPAGDHYSYMLSESVGADVINSHKAYVQDANCCSTTGSSSQTVLEEDQPLVMQWGLPRNLLTPTIDSSARTVTSYTDAQLRAMDRKSGLNI